MKALLITIKGGEQAAKQELKELLNIEGKAIDEAVEFEFEKYEQLFKLCYFSQSAIRIIQIDTPKNWLKPGMTFRVRCDEREKEAELGEKINKKNEYKVDLENPQVPFYQHKKYLGIDFTDDISKRDFRIFTHRHSLKGTTAFILLKEAGYTGKETILDPCAKDGTVILEAVHYSIKRPIRFFSRNFLFTKFEKFKDYDFEKFFNSFKQEKIKPEIYASSPDFRDVSAVRKNSRIADVTEFNLSKLDYDWLDTKFKKDEIDIIISYPNFSQPQWKEFYYQIAFLAKKAVLLVEPEFKCTSEYFETEKGRVFPAGNLSSEN